MQAYHYAQVCAVQFVIPAMAINEANANKELFIKIYRYIYLLYKRVKMAIVANNTHLNIEEN